MPRFFGHGPERETFEHLAHRVRKTKDLSTTFTTYSEAFLILQCFTNSLTSVQASPKVHNVEFVAVLPTT